MARPNSANAKGYQASGIEKIGFIAGLSKVGTRCIERLEFDRTETVGKMDSDNRNK